MSWPGPSPGEGTAASGSDIVCVLSESESESSRSRQAIRIMTVLFFLTSFPSGSSASELESHVCLSTMPSGAMEEHETSMH